MLSICLLSQSNNVGAISKTVYLNNKLIKGHVVMDAMN